MNETPKMTETPRDAGAAAHAAQARAEDAGRFIAAAKEIMGAAEERSVLVRLLGSLAYRIRCPENAHLLDEMQRVLTDLDFASERKYAKQINALLPELGYAPDLEIAGATGGERYFFEHPMTGLGVDIFMDKLDYCHPISFKGRLGVHGETIPLAELLLEKMQIVELNEKDVKDTIVLLLEHDVGEEDGEMVNVRLIARTLASDWGFYHTVVTNLAKVSTLLGEYEALGEGQRRLVRERVSKLVYRIEEEPKSLKWKTRARVGTRVPWYQSVETKP
jgi:hypothetical protein